jgi:hypothetical protein
LRPREVYVPSLLHLWWKLSYRCSTATDVPSPFVDHPSQNVNRKYGFYGETPGGYFFKENNFVYYLIDCGHAKKTVNLWKSLERRILKSFCYSFKVLKSRGFGSSSFYLVDFYRKNWLWTCTTLNELFYR